MRQNTLKVRTNIAAGIVSACKEGRRLDTIARDVESREGFLVQCARRNTRFRAKFGGQLPDNAQWVMGSNCNLAWGADYSPLTES